MRLSVNVHLYIAKKYAKDMHPIILQYRINGKVKKKVLGKCTKLDWDDVKKRVNQKAYNAYEINHNITTELAKAEKGVYAVKSGERRLTDVFIEKKTFSLKQAFDAEYLRLEREFKSGYYDKLLALEKQIKDTSIDITDIEEKWLEQLIYTLTRLGNSGNTIKKKIKLVRGMILRYSTKGVTKEVKAVTVTTHKTLKQKLTADELTRLENLPLPDNDLLTAVRDLFLLQVYLRGIRVGDLLQAYPRDFLDGRFSYSADKTGKSMTIKLVPQAQAIVAKYIGKHERLFPFFNWSPKKGVSKFDNERSRLKHKETCTSVINKYLKVLAVMAEIKKPLSSHIARHTFARMAIDKINNPMITMELLGHSSLAVHQQYLNDIRKDDVLDGAADDIFGS